MKHVRITKSRKDSYWYADKVGRVFLVEDKQDDFAKRNKHYDVIAGDDEELEGAVICVEDCEDVSQETQQMERAL